MLRQPAEYITIGKVCLPKNRIKGFPKTGDINLMKGSLLPKFDMYRENCMTPDKDSVYETWSGSNHNVSWTYAFNESQGVLWFALEYADFGGQ